ncbi:ATP-grasp domain-containing protein [Gottfriedia sp. NPDC056225]|uniref:ATP-grasp domain-containing protein n=1 Tax=Gottfriedia sp. NPDC056225 TaxID=3345751 RepID=UPI0035E14F29
MRILFCSDPLDRNQVDFDYKKEYLVAQNMGIKTELIALENLLYFDDGKKSIHKVSISEEPEKAIYRGWMLTPNYYKMLYNALTKKNIYLVNTPEEYKHCHYLPESYSVIKDKTPKTTWILKEEIDENFNKIFDKVQTFGNNPIIIKDFVKSRKHDWVEACFIPKASDKENVEKTVKKFIELQGSELNEGIVFREFLNLEFLTKHHQSQMPLSKEFRVFFLNGKPISMLHYWDEGDYGKILPNLDSLLEIAQDIKSNFFTMDIAKVENGEWVIIELGDGQVSGLPDNADLGEFYLNIKN